MTRIRLIALLLSFAVAPSTASAAEPGPWDSSFSTALLEPHLGAAPARYMVVPAGNATPELAQAQQALASALHASGKAPLVMDAQGLGPVAGLDDATLTRKAAAFPVDRVAVLRLFPDASGALTQAVVVFYDTAGQPLSSLSTATGTATAAPEAPLVSTPQAGPPPAALEQYELRRIGFDDLTVVNTLTATPVSSGFVPYEGKYKTPLEGDAFYRKLGREDLVQAYSNRVQAKTLLALVGGAAVVGGAVLFVTGYQQEGPPSCDFGSPGCPDVDVGPSGPSASSILGLGLSAVGGGMFALGLSLTPHPVTATQARELADGYNQQLQTELGLSNEKPAPAAKAPNTIQARLTPVVGPGGGGLLLSGAF